MPVDPPTTSLDALFRELVPAAALETLLVTARNEDLRDAEDVTTASLPQLRAPTEARLGAREAGVLAGLPLVREVARVFRAAVHVEPAVTDGDSFSGGAVLARLSGPAGDVLTIERTVLNLLGFLCGIATQTRRYVEAVAGTGAVVCETRKTLPGLRGLQKYAVACGGGTLHRFGLFDAALYKDNHLAHLDPQRWTDELRAAIERVRASASLRFVEVEVDTLDQLDALLALDAGLLDIILLDNFETGRLVEAVSRRDRHRPGILLEASGGITLETIGAVARTGVDRISVGALTHAVRSLDLGLDIGDNAGR